MFGNEKSASAQMSDMCEGRESVDLKLLYEKLGRIEITFESFSRRWRLLAETLNYPEPEKMRIDDELSEVIKLNNTSIFQADFEDSYEILQAIDIDSFHAAIDSGIELKTVKDALLALNI